MRFFIAVAALLIGAMPVSAGQVTVTVDGAKTHQTIEGFGTCLISWGDYPGETYTRDFVRFYRGEVGMNILREALSGFEVPETEDAAAITWRNVKPNENAQVFVEFAKELKRIDPNARLIGTVWTPPAWMKMNRDSGNGTIRKGRINRAIRADDYRGEDNRVDPAKHEHFVRWLVAVAEWHRRNGIPFYGLSPANEPRFSQWYGSCTWTAEDYAKIIAMLGGELERAGLRDVLLFGPEDMTGHMYRGGTESMIQAIASNPRALKHLDRFATHGYTDGVVADTSRDSSSALWARISAYDKPYWMTEGGTKGHDWPEPITKGVAQAIHNSLVGGHASAFVPWQVSEAKPSSHALAVHNKATKKTYAAMHYFRSIPIDAQRIDTDPAFGEVQVSAYRHPRTGEVAIIAINPSDEPMTITLKLAGLPGLRLLQSIRTTADEDFKPGEACQVRQGQATFTMPPQSIISLTGVARGR